MGLPHVTRRSSKEAHAGGHPALMRMWAKRQAGYRAMGYRVETLAAELLLYDDLSDDGDSGERS